jgi:hypothetical protein
MLVSMTSFPREESRMTTWDFITTLFSHVDEQLHAIPKHPAAYLWPSEVVTLGLLHALKDVGNQAFYRWLTRDYRVLFPLLPERTRLFRLIVYFRCYRIWTQLSCCEVFSGMSASMIDALSCLAPLLGAGANYH